MILFFRLEFVIFQGFVQIVGLYSLQGAFFFFIFFAFLICIFKFRESSSSSSLGVQSFFCLFQGQQLRFGGLGVSEVQFSGKRVIIVIFYFQVKKECGRFSFQENENRIFIKLEFVFNRFLKLRKVGIIIRKIVWKDENF